jgi:two-component system, NarL family, sensor histidine kinase UhpB
LGLGFSRGLLDASDGSSALSILPLDEAQRHFARELHDQVAHPLIELVLAVRQLRSAPPGDRDSELERLEEQARKVLRQTREMMIDLRDRGELRTDLPVALGNAIGPQHGEKIDLHVTSRWPQSINGWAAFNLLRIVEQAVVNATRHGRAEHIDVILDVGPTNEAVVIVSDDGAGIDDARGGFGVLGMQERAIIIGGTFRATERETGGTRIEVRVPMERLA